MKPAISYPELDRLVGDLLPRRDMLSTLVMPFGNTPDAPPPAYPGGEHEASVIYACQSSYRAGTPGLLATGLGAEPAYSTMTCMPATVTS